VALTILALRDYSSGVVDEQCSADASLSMSQQAPVQQVSRFSTGWFMQGVTDLDEKYMSVLEQAEESGRFWSEADQSMQPGVVNNPNNPNR
jgi:hypothetical protein